MVKPISSKTKIDIIRKWMRDDNTVLETIKRSLQKEIIAQAIKDWKESDEILGVK
jgi:hypothetical protein